MSETGSPSVMEGHEIEITRTYDAPRELVFVRGRRGSI
jgi:hypothetical protein